MTRFSAAILSLLFLASAHAFGADEPFGKIAFIEGKVKVYRKLKSIKIKKGDALLYGDRIVTSRNARMKIEKGKGNEILVTQSSRLTLKKDKKNASRIELLSGGVRCKLPNLNAKKFSVKTPVAVAGVRGTDFLVEYRP